jgi:hypothetical protein
MFIAAVRQQWVMSSCNIDVIASQVSFSYSFYNIPTQTFDYAGLSLTALTGGFSVFGSAAIESDTPLPAPDFYGTLTFSTDIHAQGSFKMAYVGVVKFQPKHTITRDEDNYDPSFSPTWSPFAGHKICVKQVFYMEDGVEKCYHDKKTLQVISRECDCLDWATALLHLTYDFINCEVVRPGISPPDFDIPQMRFV